MAQSVVLKVTFKKETRRVPLNPTTWDAVEDSLRTVFTNLAERIALNYFDDENDLITVSSDPELLEAFRLLDASKVSSYKFTLVELKEPKQEKELSEEDREKKLEEKLKKIQEKKQRKEEKAKALQARKEEREKQREEKKLIRQKEKELKALPKEKEDEKKEKKVSFSDLCHEIKFNQIQLKPSQPQPPKSIPDIPVVAQWKASVPEPDDDDELVEETIDISCESDCDLEDFLEVKQNSSTKTTTTPIPIPAAKAEVFDELPKEKVEKKEPKEPKQETSLLELQLAQLAEMGFCDRERNVELLLFNNMEMTEVVKALLGM